MRLNTALVVAFGMIAAAVIWSERGAAVAVAQSAPQAMQAVPSVGGVDVLLTMPILESQGWFIHAYGGRVRACSVDGASVVGERTAPRCSNWSD